MCRSLQDFHMQTIKTKLFVWSWALVFLGLNIWITFLPLLNCNKFRIPSKWAICQLSQFLYSGEKKVGGGSRLKTQFCVVNSQQMQAGYGWIYKRSRGRKRPIQVHRWPAPGNRLKFTVVASLPIVAAINLAALNEWTEEKFLWRDRLDSQKWGGGKSRGEGE